MHPPALKLRNNDRHTNNNFNKKRSMKIGPSLQSLMTEGQWRGGIISQEFTIAHTCPA